MALPVTGIAGREVVAPPVSLPTRLLSVGLPQKIQEGVRDPRIEHEAALAGDLLKRLVNGPGMLVRALVGQGIEDLANANDPDRGIVSPARPI